MKTKKTLPPENNDTYTDGFPFEDIYKKKDSIVSKNSNHPFYLKEKDKDSKKYNSPATTINNKKTLKEK